MSKKWRLTDRTRMLLKLELAIVLPAVALMGFSVWNLQRIQRNQAIEAAFQRDFQYVLKIAEKKSLLRANAVIESVRKEYPKPDGSSAEIKSTLDSILAKHPEFIYAVLYDKKNHQFIGRIQSSGEHDADFSMWVQEEINTLQSWVPMDADEMAKALRAPEGEDAIQAHYYGGWMDKGGQHLYQNEAFFVPSDLPKDRVTLGVVSFDRDYLQKSFFPAVMKDILSSKSMALRSDANPPAMIVHSPKDSNPWVESDNWDGGKPEVERSFTDVFPHMVFGIKYSGTTIADIGAKFLRNNLAILAALSLLMIGGIFLTYRNISRELNLARLKSDFVANVSHELRTPLALIRLYAETLELGRIASKDKYQEYFRIIREESERLTALINNILDFSRIEAGRKEYEFKETNLPELVRSTLDSYRFQIEQNGFIFEENISSDIPPVSLDREAIARSLLNLVNNALKYSKDDKYIGVSLYRTNGSVRLEVRDHGIGIPPAEQEKIFEKFYRCGDPLVHNIKGSGLGLSLVRHIVRAHGGDVKVESAPEKGSIFTIRLPLAPCLARSSQTGAAIA
jgi:signal transduction histidine kinase